MHKLFLCLFFLLFSINAHGAEPQSEEWRLRIREAAVCKSDMVSLGDIAEPYGPLKQEEWNKLAALQLWPAPPESGKPLQISKARLTQALRERLGELADRCLLPSNLAIQKDGVVLYESDLRSLVVKSLTPILNAMPGQADVTDFRLPSYIFLAHSGQSVELEPTKPNAGRLNLRFVVKEVDNSVLRRFTGSAFIDLWVDVACASRPMNKGDVVDHEGITWMRKNRAYLKGELWDGRGGPWQVIRSIGTGQPIFMTDIQSKPMIRKGNIINLLYEQSTVRISVKAEALADGRAGETISVRNLQSKKQIFGIVKDNETVIVK